MNKKIRVIISKNARDQHDLLNKIIAQEKRKGTISSIHQTILRSIEQKILWLKSDPFCGDQITKQKIPLKYKREYDATNLWRIELSDYWRMIYTIRSDEVEIINFILDIVDHKKYNKLFGYRNK